MPQNPSWRSCRCSRIRSTGTNCGWQRPDVAFVEDLLVKIGAEYHRPPGPWQHRMLAAYLEVLLIYLSRLYTEQFAADTAGEVAADKLLLQAYQAK